MTKILDKTYLSGSIAKLVELPNYYIKNGIKYDKINSIIQSNSAYNFNRLNNIIIQKMAFCNDLSSTYYYHTNQYRRNSILRDNIKSNRYYLLDGKYDDGSYPSTYYLEDNEVDPTIGVWNFSNGSYTNIDIIGQTDDYVWFAYSTHKNSSALNGSYGGLAYTGKYGYSTINVAKSINGIHRPQIIDFDGNMFKIGYLADGTFYINYLNLKSSTALEEVFTHSFYCATQDYPYQVKFSDVDKETDRIYIPKVIKDVNSKIEIVSFDIENKTSTSHPIADLNYDLRYLQVNGLFYFCELLNKGKNKYLIVGRTFSQIVPQSTMQSYKNFINFYLFKIKNNGELELKDIYNNTDSMPYMSVLFDNELESLILSTGTITDVVKVNSDEKLQRAYRYEKPIFTYGISMDKQIFFHNKDNSVEEISVGYGQDLIIKLENEKYFYNGTNIDTYFETGITDLLGNFIDTRVEFTLSGDATFNDGTKKKTIKLSKDGLLTVPIVIKGALKVCVDGKIIL